MNKHTPGFRVYFSALAISVALLESLMASPPSAVGQRVVTNGTVNVRQTANGTILGTQPSGRQGAVTGGPTTTGGFTWWNINFDSGLDGWVASIGTDVIPPNLVPSNYTISPNSGPVGTSLSVSFRINNPGGSAAAGFTTNLRLSSSSAAPSTSDPLLAQITTPSLAVGATANANLNVTIPSGTSSGTKYIWVIVDVNNTSGQTSAQYGDDRIYLSFSVTVLPNAPSGLVAFATEDLVSLAWNDNSSNEAGFKIERKTGSGGSYSQKGTTGQSVAAYIDNSISVGNTYYYRVRAYNGAGDSSYSNEFSITPQVVPPATPGYMEAQTFSNRVELGWTDTSSNETGFKIERRTGGGPYSQIATPSANSGNAAYYTDNSTSPRTTYTYRVRAYNAAGNSGYNNEVTVTTPGGPPGAFTLANEPPVWDAIIPGPKVQLNWTPSTDVGNYAVYRNESVYAAGITGTSYLNSANLTGGTTYTYFIRASNADGTTDSNTVTVNMPTAPEVAPTTPSGLAASALAALVSLAWSDNSNNEIGFRIERKTGMGGTWAEIDTTSQNIAAYIDNAVSTGTTYYYRVRAYNGGGNSGYSNERSAMPQNLSAPKPNLTMFQPSGWSDKIVVSGVAGNHADSGSFSTSDSIYVDFAFINGGTSATSTRFDYELYVDGVRRIMRSTNSPFAVSASHSESDFLIGTLSAGTHTIRVKVDTGSTITETDENDNEYSRTISVSTTQEQPVVGLTVTGRVLNRNDGLGLPGATVTLGGKSTTTAMNGTFSFMDVNIATGATLAVSLSGYLAQTQSVSAGNNVRAVNIPDISLSPANTTKPVVEWLRPDVDGIYLAGFNSATPLRTRVDWNGNSPGTVKFYANGMELASLTGAGPEFTATVNVDSRLVASFQPGANSVSVIATSASGVSSDARVRDLPVIPLPSALSSVVNSSLFQTFGPDQVGFDFELGSLDQKVTVPGLGVFGFEFGANASFDYTFSDGGWELSVGAGAEGRQGKRGSRATIPGLTRFPKTKLYIGNKEISAALSASASGVATRSTGIVLNEYSGAIGMSGRLELGRVGLVDIFGPGLTTTFSSVPGVESLLKTVSIILYVTPGIDGEAVINASPVRFRDATASGTLGLEATYNPIANVRFYSGCVSTVEFGYPAPIFREVNLRVYSGIDVSLWVLHTTIERQWIDYTYPPETEAASSLSLLQAGNGFPKSIKTSDGSWKLIERPWREAGGETFLVPNGKVRSSIVTVEQNSALDTFRRMGNARSPGASNASKEAKGSVVARVIADAPGLPAQAMLPLLSNVFPNSPPALAGRANELMLLYVRDTGVANPVQFTEVAFTHFDGISWSTPAAVAANPSGQFAPQVVFDGAGKAVAVWEEMKDPAFSATDLAAMAGQMELRAASWNPATGTWTAVALTDNAFLDHNARLSGPFTDGDLMLTWIQNEANLLTGTGVSGAATNSRVMTMRWDSATATWGAASILIANLSNELSTSLAASGNKAVYLWSKDVDGNLTDLSDTELFYRTYNASAGLWGAEIRYTNDAFSDKNAKVVLDAAGGVYAVWQRGNDLVMDRNFGNAPFAVRPDSTTMGFADVALTLGPGGNVLAIWQEMSESGSDAHYRVFDPASNTWSLDTLLSNDTALERSFAPVWDAMGNLVLAYNNVETIRLTKRVTLDNGATIDIPGVPQPGRVDLFAARRALVVDLGFGGNGLIAEGTTFLPGDATTLKVRVRNTGNVAVQNAKVAFYDGDPTAGGTLIQTVTIPDWLKSSDEQEVSIVWSVPAPTAAHSVFAVIDPESQVTEFSEVNNFSALALNGVDLQVEYLSGSVLRDGSVRVVAKVTNGGVPASAATSIKLWPRLAPGTTPLASIPIGSLSPGDSLEIPIDLPPASQAEGDASYRLTVDEDNLVGDIDATNNQLFFALNLLIDDDHDGLARAWEIANGLDDSHAGDANEDWDGDGFANSQEFFAGTNPNDPNSLLKVGQFNVVQSGNGTALIATVSWPSVAGRLYAVDRSFDLNAWQVVADNIESAPPLNSITDHVIPPNGRVFYRVKLK